MKSIAEAWDILGKHGFGKTIDKLQLVSCKNGKCIADLKISKEHANIANTLHGGLIATLIDHVTSFAIVSLQYEKNIQPGFSVNLNISYINKALEDDEIRVEGDCEKLGQNLAFTRAKVFNKITSKIIATGEHIKYIPPTTTTPTSNSDI